MKALRVTYEVEVPDGVTEEECRQARGLYEFSLLKNARRMEAVTFSLAKQLGEQFRGAKLKITIEP